MVTSVNGALRELRESGECEVSDEQLLDMIKDECKNNNIWFVSYQVEDGWKIEQVED